MSKIKKPILPYAYGLQGAVIEAVDVLILRLKAKNPDFQVSEYLNIQKNLNDFTQDVLANANIILIADQFPGSLLTYDQVVEIFEHYKQEFCAPDYKPQETRNSYEKQESYTALPKASVGMNNFSSSSSNVDTYRSSSSSESSSTSSAKTNKLKILSTLATFMGVIHDCKKEHLESLEKSIPSMMGEDGIALINQYRCDNGCSVITVIAKDPEISSDQTKRTIIKILLNLGIDLTEGDQQAISGMAIEEDIAIHLSTRATTEEHEVPTKLAGSLLSNSNSNSNSSISSSSSSSSSQSLKPNIEKFKEAINKLKGQKDLTDFVKMLTETPTLIKNHNDRDNLVKIVLNADKLTLLKKALIGILLEKGLNPDKADINLVKLKIAGENTSDFQKEILGKIEKMLTEKYNATLQQSEQSNDYFAIIPLEDNNDDNDLLGNSEE